MQLFTYTYVLYHEAKIGVLTLVGQQHLLGVVRQTQPGGGLVVREVFHPLQELLSPV